MLVSAKEMLNKAKAGHYAVGQFNINNLEWTKSILLAAEETRSPVILGVSEGAGKYMTGYKTVVGMVNGMLEELNISVPVALHLDHGSYEGCYKCIEAGFSSIMFIKQYSDIEIVSMVRARAGGFCYTNYQYEQMLENLKLLLAYGTDGVSFGFLNEDRTIDKNRCQEFLENVKNEGRKATFHRAFDCTRDPYEAIETLIDLGFDRLLTSGQEATAEEGIHLLADLQKKYGNQIEIIAGCGVNENNAQKIIDKTGIKQLHSTCRGWGVDATGMGERVSFQVSDEDGDRYRSVSVDRIKKFVEICG